MNRLLLLVPFFFVLLSACHKQPASSAREHSLKSDTSMNWTPLSFNYLVIKSKVTYKTKESSTNLTANIRMKKDSVICGVLDLCTTHD